MSIEALSAVRLPDRFNYVAAFLTMRCTMGCPYCINEFGENVAVDERDAGAWITAVNRLVVRPDLPVTLQGGEPTLHEGFYEIVAGIRPEIELDMLTNLQFDIDEFMTRIGPERMKRDAPYASIRASYHPSVTDKDDLKKRVLSMLERGYSVGVWAVEHPVWEEEVAATAADFNSAGIDFRTKEFLGVHGGRMYGTFVDDTCVSGEVAGRVECRTSELLVSASLDVYRCHSDLYARRGPVGSLDDAKFQLPEGFMECDHYGLCNPCDVKIKTNRFQEYGHTSVEIRK